MPTITFENCVGQSQTVLASEGGAFSRICDSIESPVPFRCRQGNCGTCSIEVIEGYDELIPPKTRERNTLKALGLSEQSHRLACQVQMRCGTGILRVRTLHKLASRTLLLRMRVMLDTASKNGLVHRGDQNAGDIAIIGARELKRGEVVLLAYRPPSGESSREVVGRIVRCEPDANAGGAPHHYMVVIELLEHDEFLSALVCSD